MSAKRQALRLAMYLDSMGIVPECDECRTWKDAIKILSQKFFALPADMQREAKINARALIRNEGVEPLGMAVLSLHPLLVEIAAGSQLSGQPKCDYCRSRWRFKSTWESREEAEEFCRMSSISGLRPFRCPVHMEKWHVGHPPKEG